MVQVYGDVDLSTEQVLQAALTQAQARSSFVVVDVAGMGFCSIRGMALLVDAHAEQPAGSGSRYVLSGVGPRVERRLRLLWPANIPPARYVSTAAAVLAATAHHTEGGSTEGPDPSRSPTGPGLRTDPAPDPDHDEFTTRTGHGGSTTCRELTRRHRERRYRSALQSLEESEDPGSGAQDDTTRLRLTLAAFLEAVPRDQ